MDTKQLGELGELKAQYDFIKTGWEVLLPIGNYRSYDLLVIYNDISLKIQVKTAEKIKNNIIRFYINSKNEFREKIYTKKDCDYFYLYCLENEQSYLMPVSIMANTSVSIRMNVPKNGINFANDYTFDKVIEYILKGEI